MEDTIGWQHIASKLYIWDYCTNFRHYQMPFPNLGVLQPDMRFFRAHGVKGVFEEGNYSGGKGELEELRSYLLARLMWNPDADVQRLTTEFLHGYYAPAPMLKAYLDLLALQVKPAQAHTHIFDDSPWYGRKMPLGAVGAVADAFNPTANYLTSDFLQQADQLLERGEQMADNDTIRLRVRTARVPVWYECSPRTNCKATPARSC